MGRAGLLEAGLESRRVNVSIEVAIEGDTDIVTARKQGRTLAAGLGFSSSEATVVAAAIAELARNIVMYAKRGAIILKAVNEEGRCGVVITACDEGMGIPDLARALRDGYSTSGGLGIGLPGVKRLMDEFDIVSEVGKGTVITTAKWHTLESPPVVVSSPQFHKGWGRVDAPALREPLSIDSEPSMAQGPFGRPEPVRVLTS